MVCDSVPKFCVCLVVLFGSVVWIELSLLACLFL